MGLCSKLVSGDQGHDWDHSLLQPPATVLPKPPPPTRRQHPRLQETEAVKCPRCDSTNTKFCYYNNYNKSQPRHFCKSCKRHWTKGGNLRNVPVGGGRKNKRPKISNAPSITAATSTPLMGPTLNTQYANQITDFLKMGPTKATAQHTKDANCIIHEALIGSSSSSSLHEPIPFMKSNNGTGPSENLITEFPISSLSSNFDVNYSLVPNSNYVYNQFGANLDSMEESTVTTINVPASTSMPWPGPGLDTSYWNWNEIDVLTSADHLNIVWDDDAEIKP